jgi:dTDP-glucose 4,6-dehydratase
MSKKVLVLGCNSFSGSVTVKSLLDNGFQVVGASRSERLSRCYRPFEYEHRNFEFLSLGSNFNPDILVEICKRENIKSVINFAAQSMVAESWDYPKDWYLTNCVWLSELAGTFEKWGKLEKFIQFSTPEVYGSTTEWVKESFNFNPTTPYAVSRAAGDLHLRALFREKEFPVIFMRTANIYGPHQARYRIVPKAILSMLLKEKLPLHGGGSSRRSFVFSEDVASAVLTILEEGSVGETYHVSGKDTVRIIDLVDLIFQITNSENRELIEVVGDRSGKDEAYLLNSDKIRQELSWQDKTPLRNGIEMTLEWAIKFENELKSQPSIYSHRS